MSDSVIAAEVEGNGDFQQVLIAKVLEKASAVRLVSLSGSRSDQSRAAFADILLSDKVQVLNRFGRLVALTAANPDGTFDVTAIDSRIDELWDTLAGVPTQSGALAISSQAQSMDFQQRVYVIGARLAGDILASAPPAPEATAAAKAVDTVKRVFALKYQAGRFIGQQYQLNYAVNVLAPLTPEEAAGITDEEIYDRLESNTTLFANTQAALLAAGVSTGLLS